MSFDFNVSLREPRIYYDVVLVRNPSVHIADRETFTNRERFPVVLDKIVFYPVDFRVGEGVAAWQFDESVLLWFGARINIHDNHYMQREFLPLPNWVNTGTFASEYTSYNSVVYALPHPITLGVRDSLLVEVQGNPWTIPDIFPLRVSVAATGVGAYSSRPFMLGGTGEVEGFHGTQVDPSHLRNIGAEPISIDTITLSVWPPTYGRGGALFPSSSVFARIRQLGSGSGRYWTIGPPTLEYCPISLFGTCQGRALVHSFLKERAKILPGDSIQIELKWLGDDSAFSRSRVYRIGVAVHGWLCQA